MLLGNVARMRINLLRHNCGVAKFLTGTNDDCPFYWMMRGGDTYYGNIYYFTFLGIRLVINTTKKKDLWTT